jgi:sucrose-6-phosphate hydrolase SacC (GH32 family)
MKPTLVDCAEIMEIEKSTIEKWIRKNHNQTFSDFRDQKMAHTRFMIVRNIIRECEKGNVTMLIYASKNLCNWTDNPKDLKDVKDAVEQLVIRYNEKNPEKAIDRPGNEK